MAGAFASSLVNFSSAIIYLNNDYSKYIGAINNNY